RRRNLIAGERPARTGIEHRRGDRRQIASPLGQRRDRGVLVERIARVVAGVVHEEERARAVDDLRNDERSAERAGETLLQITRLRRRAVERVRCGVERRRVEVLRDVAANLVVVAAAAASGKRAALPEPSAASTSAAGSSASSSTGATGARVDLRKVSAAQKIAEALRKIAGTIRPAEKRLCLRRR